MNVARKLADLEAAKRHAEALLKLKAKYPDLVPAILTEESLSPLAREIEALRPLLDRRF